MIKKISATVLVSLCLMVFAAQAEEDHHGVCAKDKETLCPGMKKGEGLYKCMHEHKDKLSADCKAKHEKMKENIKEAKEVCNGDIEKLCKDIKPGQGRIIQCLKTNKDKLSEACKAEFKNK